MTQSALLNEILARLNQFTKPVVRGNFLHHEVLIDHRDTRRLVTSAATRQEIDRIWEERTRANPHLFDGPQVRLDTSEIEAGRLKLQTSLTSYKEFVGTNLSHPEWARELGSEYLANPLGVSGLIRTADNYLLLGRRSPHVAEYALFIDSFGGNLSPVGHRIGGVIDPFRAMETEITEELAVAPGAVVEVIARGVWENRQTHRPEVIFTITLSTPVGAIRLRDEEHTELFSVKAETLPLLEFIQTYEMEITPSCKAAVLDLLE